MAEDRARGNRRHSRWAAIALAAAASSAAATAENPLSASVPDAEPPHVRIEVIAAQRAVGPDESIWVAVVQHIDAGWHTYWVNPGDAGVATRIEWTLPQGYSVGQPQWPAPRVFRSGPIVSYGYEGQVVTLQQLRAPRAIVPGAVTLVADVRWLACHDICIPGRESARIELRQAATTPAERDPAGERRIAAARARLPADAPWAATLEVRPQELVLRLHAAAGALSSASGLHFLPAEWGHVDNAAPQVVTHEGGDVLLTLVRGELRDRNVRQLEGLLRIGSESEPDAPRTLRVLANATD